MRDRKIGNIERLEPDVIAAGNIGCITQIAAGTAIPVVHTVELLDWATGGPAPEGLRGDRSRCGSGAFELKRHDDATQAIGRFVMAKAKKRKTKVKKSKTRCHCAQSRKPKKGKRAVKKAVRKDKHQGRPPPSAPRSASGKTVARQERRRRKPKTYKIMIMGASYGSLLASKILFGGHSVHLVCLPAEADLINAEGFRVRLPVRGRTEPMKSIRASCPAR